MKGKSEYMQQKINNLERENTKLYKELSEARNKVEQQRNAPQNLGVRVGSPGFHNSPRINSYQNERLISRGENLSNERLHSREDKSLNRKRAEDVFFPLRGVSSNFINDKPLNPLQVESQFDYAAVASIKARLPNEDALNVQRIRDSSLQERQELNERSTYHQIDTLNTFGQTRENLNVTYKPMTIAELENNNKGAFQSPTLDNHIQNMYINQLNQTQAFEQ